MFGFLNRDNSRAPVVREARDIVGCFGKMPVHADFIKHNITTREAVALDNWVQEGFMLMSRKYGEEWKNKLAAAPSYNFVWVGNEEERTLGGVLRPGTDKSGRCYPFCAFTALDRPVLKDMQAAVPLARGEFFNALENVLSRPWGDEGLPAFTRALDATACVCSDISRRDLIEIEMSVLGNISMGEFWGDILPGAERNIKAAFVRTLISSLQTVSRRTPQRVHWGIRLPLPSKPDPIPYVVFWVQLCESMLSGRSWHAQYFWNEPAPGFPPRLTVFFKPVPPSYFSTLVEAQRNDGSILDVIDELESETGNLEGMYHLVDNAEMRLVDALQSWRPREIV